MAYESDHPAVFAGLAGAFAVPVCGMAAVALSDANSLQAPFALGCLSGSVIMCGVCLGTIVHERRARELDALYRAARSQAEGKVGSSGHQAWQAGEHGSSGLQPRGRHMATQEWERTGTIRVQQPTPPFATAAAVEPSDYVDVAERYVAATRRLGGSLPRISSVRDVLLERIGAGLSEQLPVIERADGPYVAPSATAPIAGSAVDPSLSKTGDLGRSRHRPRHMAPAGGKLGEAASPELASPVRAAVMATGRAATIAQRVAEVEIGVFPEQRSAADLGTTDSFSKALAAMDARFAVGVPQPEPVFAPLPAFRDVVGDADSIDEPSGLEPSTDFLSFRVPAGHPEVVDEESYVDYLIGEEFAANPSPAARRSSRDFLRVIQGGQQSGEERYAQAL